MKKTIILAVAILVIVYGTGLLCDMEMLHENVIRLHVVGATDSEKDQTVKLAVKDAINETLNQLLVGVNSTEDAKAIILDQLSVLKACGEQVLRDNGFQEHIWISLEQEAFPVREYDTFSLPSGVYTSLRIRIGEAEGRNWWCVVFPSLCLPAVGENFDDVAAGAGFSDSLCDTLTGEPEYELRFFFLDWLGKLQNFFFEK